MHAGRAQAAAALDAAQLTALIDQTLADAWSRAGIEPAPAADDAEYLRRVHLDLAGRIPSVAELQIFLADERPDKRAAVVDDLLGRGVHAQHFANTWRTLMLAESPEILQAGALVPQFDTWLRLRFAVNMPYDRLVSELLTAPTDVTMDANSPRFVPTPAAFFQANEQKREQVAASASRIFLGVQVQCAQCHDHPFARWTRREFWSLAAFFDGGANDKKPQGGTANAIRIPETDITVEPVFLDGKAPDWASGASKRELLSRWMTQTDNPFFARAAVNRMWDHFLGRGFVHPVDDLDDANPPTHPELLAEMSRQFALHGYDINYLVRAITGSRAYQLTSRAGIGGSDDLAQFARMPLRRMTSDQLFASIVQATGFREQRRRSRAGVLADPTSAAVEFRNRFADQAVPRTEAETSILQALALMNGKLIGNATDLKTSETLSAIADAPFLDTQQRVEALCLATLSRKPTPEETEELAGYIDRAGTENGPSKQALADVFWALLNCAEFALNH